MSTTGSGKFVKKAQKRLSSQQGDIFVSPHIPLPPDPQPQMQPEDAALPQQSQQQPVSHPTSKLSHHMSRKEKINFVIVRSLGNFLLLLSLYGVGATFGPALYYEVQFQVMQARGIHYSIQAPTITQASSSAEPVSAADKPVTPSLGNVIAGAKEQVLVPPDTQFSIVIPKIGATAKVIPNVDPTNEADYLPKLMQGVAHARGSVFPGMEGTVYLFAHSTDNFWDVGRYNAVFYLIKDLKPGDEIAIFFEGRRYNYKVDHSVIKDASDVEFLTKSQETPGQQLILQTCWPPGTAWKRLFVIAKPQ